MAAFVLLGATGATAANARLPVPPIPPAGPPTLAAPVPDPNIVGPSSDGRKPFVTLDTDINRPDRTSEGFGYPAGSRYQIDDDRRWFVVPGIMLHVPLP
jgi:hypothetical protein